MSMLVSIKYAVTEVCAFLSIISGHSDIPVLTGAACGAAIFIINTSSVNGLSRLCYFFISFFLGSSCAESVASLLRYGMEKFMTPAPDINKTFTAALTAAIAVRLINKVGDLLLKKISDRK